MDDNEDAASMLAMFLELLGYTVCVEHDSAHALERARAERPQVCVLDIGLPGMDGSELAARLRSMPETRQALLIAATGYGQKEDRDAAAKSGFDHHLVKPVDTEQLTRLIARATERARHR